MEVVAPQALTQLVEAGGWSNIYSTTEAIDRISQAGGSKLMAAVGANLDQHMLDRMLDDVPSLESADALFWMLVHLNREMGVRLFEMHAERFAAMFSSQPLENFHAMYRTFGFLLGYLPLFLSRDGPTPDGQQAAATFLRALDTAPLIDELSRPTQDGRWHNFWEFLAMFVEADRHGWFKVANSVDLKAIEATLVEQTPTPSENLLYVLYVLCRVRANEIRAILDANSAEIGELHRLLVLMHPGLTVQLLKRGIPLDLGLEGQRYETAAEQLELIGQLDVALAREVAEANGDAFGAGLAARHSPPFQGLGDWVMVCDRLAPALIDSVLAGLSKGVVASWAQALRSPKSEDQIAPLVFRAAETGTETASGEAAELMRQFASLRRTH